MKRRVRSLGPWHEGERVRGNGPASIAGVLVLFALLAWMVCAPDAFRLTLRDGVEAVFAWVLA